LPSSTGAPHEPGLSCPGLRDAVRAAGYQGPWCIESFTPDNDAIARAASIWRSLAESQDDIATDGLAFLRRLLA
jgi:D-psicose/D-tagatose/L-ribulose 3-epimerase